MFRRIASRLVLLVLTLSLCVQPLTADTSLQRIVTPAEGQPGGTYHVVLVFPPGQVWGIEETFSPGITFISSDLSDDSVRVSGNGVNIALIHGQNVSYLITLDPGTSGEIAGTYLNMLTGENRVLPGARISGSGSVDIVPSAGDISSTGREARIHPAPLGLGILAVAFCTGGALFLLRRGTR